MRKDIVIEVKSPSRQYAGVENWEHLDTYADQKITLQFISNLLTGVESITSSSTLSVKLPRTVRNDRIFDLATRPQHQSSMTHRKIECRVYINGIDMMKAAYCYLLDCESDNYEVAIVFGLLQNYGQWLTENPKLRDLQERGEYILWNEKCAVDCTSIWWSNYPSLYTSLLPSGSEHNLASQFYALYNCGVTRDATSLALLNLHPCVTLREIYERIISENSLNFNMPTSVLLDMEELAIVQVERNQPEQGEEQTVSVAGGNANNVYPATYGMIQASLGGLCGRIGIPNGDYYQAQYWLYQGEGYVRIDWDFYLRPNTGQGYVFGEIFTALHETYGNLNYVRLAVYDRTTAQIVSYAPTSYNYSGGVVSNVRFRGSRTFTHVDNMTEGSTIAEMAIWLDPQMTRIEGAIPYVAPYFRTNDNGIFTWSGFTQLQTQTNNDYFQYTYIEGTTPYPNQFKLIPNLPDITQLEFIKAICQMYCLFPVVNDSSDEIIDFVPIDKLTDNIQKKNTYDWSDKLLEYTRDVPKKISYRIGDYARRNIIKYKDDDNEKYPFHSEAVLVIDDDTLEKEKTIIEFPWAATKVDKITQYELTEETDDSDPPTVTYEAEFTQCEYRLVRITEWQRQSDCANVAQFKDLDAEYILSTYYATYQAAIRQPKIITEHIRLNELEMRDVDFTIPVYLRKYGRFFAIKQIQWTAGDEYAEVELLQLAGTKQSII